MENIINKIKELYLTNTLIKDISKEVGLNRGRVRIILKELGIHKNRFISYEDKDYKFKDDKWYGYWICNQCHNEISCYAKKIYNLHRKIRNSVTKKYICWDCSVLNNTGEGNPFYNKKHDEETKKRISNSRMGKWSGDDNHMKKPKYRKLKSCKMKEFYKSERGMKVRQICSETIKKTIRTGKLKTSCKSKIEYEVLEKLKNFYPSTIHSFRIDTKFYDFYIPELNLLIEYHGDYWHCNPNKYPADYLHVKKNELAKDIWKNDEYKLDLSLKNGYLLEVIWDSDYKKNPTIIENLIKKYEKHN